MVPACRGPRSCLRERNGGQEGCDTLFYFILPFRFSASPYLAAHRPSASVWAGWLTAPLGATPSRGTLERFLAGQAAAGPPRCRGAVSLEGRYGCIAGTRRVFCAGTCRERTCYCRALPALPCLASSKRSEQTLYLDLSPETA